MNIRICHECDWVGYEGECVVGTIGTDSPQIILICPESGCDGVPTLVTPARVKEWIEESCTDVRIAYGCNVGCNGRRI